MHTWILVLTAFNAVTLVFNVVGIVRTKRRRSLARVLARVTALLESGIELAEASDRDVDAKYLRAALTFVRGEV